jgi:hypothetical protein
MPAGPPNEYSWENKWAETIGLADGKLSPFGGGLSLQWH